MKGTIAIFLAAFVMLGAATLEGACFKTGFQFDNTNITATRYFYDRNPANGATVKRFNANYISITLRADAVGTCTIRRLNNVLTSTSYADSSGSLTVEPGQTILSSDGDIRGFLFTKTAATDYLSWDANRCTGVTTVANNASTMDLVEAEWITITDGFKVAIGNHYSFVPLIPVGEHNLISFQISCTTWPDTLWYQVICSNTMMDSTTVFNFGTTAAPQYVKYITSASLATSITTSCEYLDNSSMEKWTPTGAYVNSPVFSFTVQDQSGWPGLPKFVGIKVGADAAKACVGLKVICGLATVATCGG